jgi:hypothetical protein
MRIGTSAVVVVFAAVASATGAACTTVPVEPADSGVADRTTVDAPSLDARSEEDATSVDATSIDAMTVDTIVQDATPVMCAANERMCSGACTNVSNNDLHCGMCDRACAASETCTAGTSAWPARERASANVTRGASRDSARALSSRSFARRPAAGPSRADTPEARAPAATTPKNRSCLCAR